MLHYAVIFFVIALVAALFGFGGIAAGAASIAKILFFIFLVLFVVSLVAGLLRRVDIEQEFRSRRHLVVEVNAIAQPDAAAVGLLRIEAHKNESSKR